MKKKVIFWVVMILANAVIGVVSVRTYQKLEARVAGVETHQKNYDEMYLKNYNEKSGELTLAHEKTVAGLSKVLGIDGKYDFNNNLIKEWDLKKFFDYRVYAKTSLLLKTPEELIKMGFNILKEVKGGSESPAIVIGKYVLMTSHTNDAEVFKKEASRFQTPQGIVEVSFAFIVLEYKVSILLPNGEELALKELYRNKEKDFSLFEMPVPQRALNFPFKIGDSSQLKIGKFIYLNGRPGLNSEVARSGHVTALLSATQSGEKQVEKDYYAFGISQSTEKGDSGSPIIAFRDGKPELVGFYLGWAGNYNDNGKNVRSRALKVNAAVDEIKEKYGVDLRELQRQILSSR